MAIGSESRWGRDYGACLFVDGSTQNLKLVLSCLYPSAIVGLSSPLEMEDGVLEFDQICLSAEESGIECICFGVGEVEGRFDLHEH